MKPAATVVHVLASFVVIGLSLNHVLEYLALHHGQLNIVLLGHAAEIENGVAHASEGGIDAHAGDVGNLLERQVLIEAHVDNLALGSGQTVHHAAHVVKDLLVDDLALPTDVHDGVDP